MAGEKQVRDEVHAVIELDPVGRGASDAVPGAVVEASQQRGQIVHNDGFHIGWNERLARDGGHVVVQQQRSVGRLDCAQEFRHQVIPAIAGGVHEGVESRGDRWCEPGECPALRNQALSVEGSTLVDPHVHAAGDRPLEVVLLVRSELERAGQDELAPDGRIRLLHGVAPEREPGAQAIDPFERGRTLAELEHSGAGRGVIDRLGFVAGNEGRCRRCDLGEHLGVAVGEVHGAGTQELTHDRNDVIRSNEVKAFGKKLPLWSLVHGAYCAHHPVVKDDAVVEPLGQVLPSDIPSHSVRGPCAERAPVGGLRPQQLTQSRGEIRIGLGDPVVAKNTVVDGEHRLDVRRCGSPIHAAHLHPAPPPSR